MSSNIVEYSRRGLAIDSILFYMDGAKIRRQIPPLSFKSETLLIRIFNFDGNISKSSVSIDIANNVGICVDYYNHGQMTPQQVSTLSESSIKPEGYHKDILNSFYYFEVKLRRQSTTMQDTIIHGLKLVYTTPSMYWSTSYVFKLDTVESDAVLYTMARLHNQSSEIWDECKIVLSTRKVLNGAARTAPATRLQSTAAVGSWKPHCIIGTSITKQQPPCPCVRGKVGFSTTWYEGIECQNYFAGVYLLQRPIRCARFEKVAAYRQMNYLRIEAKPAPFLFPGPVTLELNNYFIGWTELRQYFPGEVIIFTCMMVEKLHHNLNNVRVGDGRLLGK
ncbi:hypothetical protein BGZ63DRAFT_468454 [Mariannaea sp. PMI_226]|nr:hypothetical protein BGZ63DRAFT_468454 [Mariannaea sp. PMI_226]